MAICSFWYSLNVGAGSGVLNNASMVGSIMVFFRMVVALGLDAEQSCQAARHPCHQATAVLPRRA
jgi:hypothetical protein